MASDTLLFVFGLFDTGALLFLTVYFVITLSDLECDYLNAQQCCGKLNIVIQGPEITVKNHCEKLAKHPCVEKLSVPEHKPQGVGQCLSKVIAFVKQLCQSTERLRVQCVLPEIISHGLLTVLLLLGWHWMLLLLNAPMTAWQIYQYVSVPSGNVGIYDPTEIHNRGNLKSHMKESMIKLGYYLVFFFIYLYCMIVSLLTKEPAVVGVHDPEEY